MIWFVCDGLHPAACAGSCVVSLSLGNKVEAGASSGDESNCVFAMSCCVSVVDDNGFLFKFVVVVNGCVFSICDNICLQRQSQRCKQCNVKVFLLEIRPGQCGREM